MNRCKSLSKCHIHFPLPEPARRPITLKTFVIPPESDFVLRQPILAQQLRTRVDRNRERAHQPWPMPTAEPLRIQSNGAGAWNVPCFPEIAVRTAACCYCLGIDESLLAPMSASNTVSPFFVFITAIDESNLRTWQCRGF